MSPVAVQGPTVLASAAQQQHQQQASQRETLVGTTTTEELPRQQHQAVGGVAMAGTATDGGQAERDRGGCGAEEENDEPVLKYQRMGADVGELLSEKSEQESVVRMAVHDSYLVS